MSEFDVAVLQAFRSAYGRTVAIVMRTTRDLGAAEDAVQDAFAIAAEHWPTHGVPPNPQALIVTTARNRAIDRIRRIKTAERFAPQLLPPAIADIEPEEDDELRMILLCAHPSLSPESQLVLTLRFVGGLTPAEIARAVGGAEAAVMQRLTRAKRKIRDGRLGLPEPACLSERLDVVLAVIYAIYNEGYVATSGALSRFDLCQEGLRLARVVAGQVRSQDEAKGLLALLLFLQARHDARIGPDGELIPLPDQNRNLWDRAMIQEGHMLVRECLAANRPGPYQVQAAIQAVHCDALRDEDTDWGQILALYDILMRMIPTAAVRTARIVTLSYARSLREALDETDPASSDRYMLAVRADILARMGKAEESRQLFLAAARLATNDAERRHMLRRAAEMDHS